MSPDEPAAPGPVGLADLLTKQLVTDVIEALATRRMTVSKAVQAHATEFLDSLLQQRRQDLGGARSAQSIHPIAIKKSALLKDVIRRGAGYAHVPAMVWADARSALRTAAEDVARKQGILTTDFSLNHLHPLRWERSLLDRLSKDVAARVPGATAEQAALMLFVLSDDVSSSCASHRAARDRSTSASVGSGTAASAPAAPAVPTPVAALPPLAAPPTESAIPVLPAALLGRGTTPKPTAPSDPPPVPPPRPSGGARAPHREGPTVPQLLPIAFFDKGELRQQPLAAVAQQITSAVVESAQGTVSARHRTALRNALRRMADQLGMGPLRESARDTGLLGKEAKRADPSTLKRLISDSDQLAKLVADALDDRARQASGLRTLQRIAMEGEKDPTLDHRARNQFQRARKAFEAGDWATFNRSFEGLKGLRFEHPHALLDLSSEMVLFASGDLNRVLHALDQTGSAPAKPPKPSQPAASPLSTRGADLHDYSGAVDRFLVPAREAASVSIPLAKVEASRAAVLAARDQLVALDITGGAAETRNEFHARNRALVDAADSYFIAAIDVATAVEQRARAVSGLLGISLSPPPWLESSTDPSILLTAIETAATRATAVLAALAGVTSTAASAPALDSSANLSVVLRELEAFNERVVAAAVETASLARAEAERASMPTQAQLSVQGPNLFRFASGAPLASAAGSSLVSRLRQEAVRKPMDGTPAFLPLPLEERACVLDPEPGAKGGDLLTAAARDLFGLWSVELRSPTRPLAQLMDFVPEARRIRSCAPGDLAGAAFDSVVVALAFQSASEERARAKGIRRLGALLGSTGIDELSAQVDACAVAASNSPAVARVCAELVEAGFETRLSLVVSQVALRSAADGRRLLDAIGIAAALCSRDRAIAIRGAVLRGLGAVDDDIQTIDDHLADLERPGRRSNRPDVPPLTSQFPLVTDFAAALGHRVWERGKAGVGQSRISVTIPKAAQKGLFITPGTRNVEVPLLVRNGTDTAVGGISIFVAKPLKGDSPLRTAGAELHVPWLSDQNLEDSAAVALACTLELDPERVDGFRDLRLSVRSSWFGGRGDETYVIPIRTDHVPQDSVVSVGMGGYDGRPVDLNDERTFRFSSTSVQRSFAKLRDDLKQGKPVRAYIFGRRRRGKSSICTSLRDNREVQQTFAVQDKVWNGARMTTVATAFSALAEILVTALAKTGVNATKLDVSDLTSAAEMSQRFLYWVDTISDSLPERKRVLLLLDEFQKWLAGLGSGPERLALLGALRHFNDRPGNLEVSFVLSGLQNLKALVQESNDLANALEAFEIKALTNEESDRYVRERLPIDLDGRTRRRLISLSGGNPYVLNRLGGNLLETLKEKGRHWCTAADVDGLLAESDAQTGRLAEFVKYMLHEDEDDGAASLRQLSVLRGAASLLQERGDFDGYVRTTDVEDWLKRNNVEFESGQVALQLEELSQLDLVQSRPGGRFHLRGEWLCRSLAALDPTQVKLQPVTQRGDPELVLGRYNRKQLLGRGGQAEVWLAENVHEGGRDVVLRIYPAQTVGLTQRIEREKAILDQVKHPNVVAFYGASIDARHGGIVVLEHIDGYTLDALFEKQPAAAATILPGGDRPKQIELIRKLVGAVEACHAAGVVHKDLSPRNVMVAQQLGVWEPKVIDFGIAGFDTQPVDGLETTVIGTPGYIAPEKLRSRGARRSKPADVFSLGALLIRLLTGREPDDVRLSPAGLAVECKKSGLPDRLIDLITRMVADAPEGRPGVDEIKNALETVLDPLTWRELHSHATAAVLEDRSPDATKLYGQALAAVLSVDRAGADYFGLLDESLDLLVHSAGARVPWDHQWLSHWLSAARVTADVKPPSKQVLTVMLKYRAHSKDAGTELMRELVARLAEPPTSIALAPLVASLARDEHFREPNVADGTFDALAAYCAERHIDDTVIEDFSVNCARGARVKRQNLLGAELWLQRARRLGGAPRADYNSEMSALVEARRKTGKLQTLPSVPASQQPFKIGEGEKGHMGNDRLAKFDENVRRRFPFVAYLKRVTKDPNLHFSRPTLLRLDNLASHVPQGTTNVENIIPLALDASITGDIVMRVNIFLVEGTTSSQREAAYNVLKAGTDLFDCLE